MKNLFLIFALLLAGCRTLDPGADALVVRAEQLNQQAHATFTFLLKTDHINREFFRNTLPDFHEFCEQLRDPIPYQERLNVLLPPTGSPVVATNYLPRYRVALLTLDDTIMDYKLVKSVASSNAVSAALTALQSLVFRAQAWTMVATNELPKGTP